MTMDNARIAMLEAQLEDARTALTVATAEKMDLRGEVRDLKSVLGETRAQLQDARRALNQAEEDRTNVLAELSRQQETMRRAELDIRRAALDTSKPHPDHDLLKRLENLAGTTGLLQDRLEIQEQEHRRQIKALEQKVQGFRMRWEEGHATWRVERQKLATRVTRLQGEKAALQSVLDEQRLSMEVGISQELLDRVKVLEDQAPGGAVPPRLWARVEALEAWKTKVEAAVREEEAVEKPQPTLSVVPEVRAALCGATWGDHTCTLHADHVGQHADTNSVGTGFTLWGP